MRDVPGFRSAGHIYAFRLYIQWILSLVLRPSHHPVVGCLQIAETEGEEPGPFYHMNDANVYLMEVDRGGGGVLDRKNAFCVSALCSERVVSFPLCEPSELHHLDRHYKKRPQANSFIWGLPPSVYQGRH